MGSRLSEITLFKDEDIWLTMENEDNILPGVFVHNELLTKLTPSKLKKAKEVWREVSKNLYAVGVPSIYAIPLEPDNEKWTERFGFTFTGITIDSYKLYKHRGA